MAHRYVKYRALGTYSLVTDENERKAAIEVGPASYSLISSLLSLSTPSPPPPHLLLPHLPLPHLPSLSSLSSSLISPPSSPLSPPSSPLPPLPSSSPSTAQDARSKKGDAKRPPRVDLSPSLLVKHLAEEVSHRPHDARHAVDCTLCNPPFLPLHSLTLSLPLRLFLCPLLLLPAHSLLTLCLFRGA